MKSIISTFFFVVIITNISAQYYKIDLIKDINPGIAYSFPRFLAKVDATSIYFSADDGQHGYELWKSNGTTTGTQMVMDINNVGTNSSNPFGFSTLISEVFSFNRYVYFSANDGTNGNELWRSQIFGTEPFTTTLVKDINPTGSSSPRVLTDVNGLLMFGATNGTNGREFWKSNGTSVGTTMIQDYQPSFDINITSAKSIVAIGNTAYFSAVDNSSALLEITPTNVSPVNINVYSGSTLNANFLTKVNNNLFFSGVASNGSPSLGRELFVKPQGQNAFLIKDINLSPNIFGGTNSSDPSNLTDVNGTLFFTAFNGTSYGIWKSDGNTPGTQIVKTIDAKNLCNVNGTLFFFSNSGSQFQLWKSDGTTNGTVLVKTINNNYNSLNEGSFVNFNGKFIFESNSDIYGSELWQSDGTSAGTFIIKDINPGSQSSIPEELCVVNSSLYFRANDGIHGVELFKMYNCFGPELNYTTKNGNWNDPTTWSCGRVPVTTESVTIKGHTINVNGSYGVGGVVFEGGNITLPIGSMLTYYPISP